MLFLAAALLFSLHYSVADSYSNFVSDSMGYAYLVSGTQQGETLTYAVKRYDPDGNIIYNTTLPFPDPTPILMAADSAGNLYIVDQEPSVFLTKVDPTGNVLSHFNTQIGSGIAAIAIGPDGSIFLTGASYPGLSTGGLQTTPGAYVSSSRAAPSQQNAFVVKINAQIKSIVYATFLDNAPQKQFGAFASSAGFAIAVDSNGDAYVAGTTDDNEFPVSSSAFDAQCDCIIGTLNVFVTKLNGDGSNIIYSSFVSSALAGISYFAGNGAISVDSGLADSLTFYPTNHETAAVTARIDQYGENLLSYDTVTTGSVSEVTPDGQGDLLVTAYAAANDPRPTAGAFTNGANYAAVIRISDGVILYATLLPTGSAGSWIAPDGSGGFIVAGEFSFARFVPSTAPNPAIYGVANVAGLQVSSALAPGEAVSIYGTGLGPAQGVVASFDSSGHLPQDLAGVEVYFDGIRAPLLYASSQQVNAMVPFELAQHDLISVVLLVNGSESTFAYIPGAVAAPEIFKSGSSYFGFVLNQDGSTNSESNPAKVGSVVTVFVSGAGSLNPPLEDGSKSEGLGQLALPVGAELSVSAQLGGMGQAKYGVVVLYAGPAPTLVAGITQFNLRLPPGTQTSQNATISLNLGDTAIFGTSAGIWITN
jgi:uncharacterized protein (TIGR03437 family)